MSSDNLFDHILNNKRYNEIFKELVDEYIETGEPVGSRTLSKRLDNSLSPATIRNVMADLEELGVLCSEHTSSGRKPTERGWRYFVNTFIEVSTDLQDTFLESLKIAEDKKNTSSILERISEMLSNLSSCASIILTPTVNDKIVKYLDFVLLSAGRILAVIVLEDGSVENRLIYTTDNISSASLEKAANYLNEKFCGKSLAEISGLINDEITIETNGLDETTNNIIVNGMGIWETNEDDDNRQLIVKGHSNLLSNIDEIENIKQLFNKLDEKRTVKTLLDEAINGHGIQVFIGSENKAFELVGCSMVISPYTNASTNRIIGAIGIIGPERMKYDKVINLVDCTAKMLSKLI